MMNRKIVIVLGLCICIIWSVYAVTISVQNESDTDVSDRGQDICAGQDESVTDADYNIQDLGNMGYDGRAARTVWMGRMS